MKKTKNVVSLLIAVILIIGMASTVSAAVPKNSNVEFMQNGVVYGKYPEFTEAGYEAINKKIRGDLVSFFGGFTQGTQGASGAFAGGDEISLSVTPIKDDDGFISFTINSSRKFPGTTNIERKVIGTYIIDTAKKALSTQAALDAHLAAPGAGASTVIIPAQPTLYDQVVAAFEVFKTVRVVADAEGYVSLKRYADALGGDVSYNNGWIDFRVNRVPIVFDIDPAIWAKAGSHVRTDAPVYLVGDDILVHATLIYPIYGGKVSVNSSGVVVIGPK